MKRPSGKLLIWLCVLVSPIVAWNIAYPTDTIRYKVTVNIETPEGLKSGSAVRELKVMQQPELPESGPHIEVKGEAVAVDLGARGVAFAVMGTDDYYILFNTYPESPPALRPSGLRYFKAQKDVRTVALQNRPLIVAFRDIKDPKTVESVYRVIATPMSNSPDYTYKVEDDFEKIFGKGVHLKDITIETTDEKVTCGVERYLLWFKGYPEAPLLEKIDPYDFSVRAVLREGNFIQGDKK